MEVPYSGRRSGRQSRDPVQGLLPYAAEAIPPGVEIKVLAVRRPPRPVVPGLAIRHWNPLIFRHRRPAAKRDDEDPGPVRFGVRYDADPGSIRGKLGLLQAVSGMV